MLVGLIFIFGCGGSHLTTPASTSKPGNPTVTAQNSLQIQGRWVSSTCQVAGPGNAQNSSKTGIQISDKEMNVLGSNYSTADCTGPVSALFQFSSSYLVAGGSAIDSSVLLVDAKTESSNVTIMDQVLTDAANRKRYCGFNDWQTGISKDVTSKNCFKEWSPGKVIYSILKVASTQLKRGQPEAGHEGNSPDRRHINVSDEVFYKQ